MRKFLSLVCILFLLGCSLAKPQPVQEITEYEYGVINFYSESTEEHTKPVITASVALSEEEADEIKKHIEDIGKWVCDATIDRLPFFFNGEIKFADNESVYYFSFDSLIYHDIYFATFSKDAAEHIKRLK